MKTQVLNKEGLSTYDQEIKDYIKSQGMGVTLEEVKALIDSSDKNTTYTLTKNENNEIVLTGSDGSTTSVTDSDTNTTYSTATTSANGLMSSSDKAKLDSIVTGANAYTHPTTSGNKHIPSGGSSGQILRWSADGTAVWGADNNTTYSDMKGATSSASGTHGLVPAPASGKQSSFLRGDGTWAVPTDTNTWRPLGTTADTACAGNDSRLSNARPASDVYAWAKSSSKPSYSWDEITSKPSTFSPASHTHNYAGSSSAGGSATSAVKLDSSAGSATQPVYFSGGKPVACTYTLGKSVPENAVFTDTVYDDSSLSSKVTQNTKDISALKTADNVLSSRIDAFTSLTQGSTTGDAELIDIRIGADGTPYNNAGSAVRGQINTLRSEILQTYEIASVDEINNYLGIEVI